MLQGSPARVLVVEDEPDLAVLMVDLLSAEGYRPVVARDGQEALALASSEQPSLVILDLALPDLDGRDVLRSLKSNRATAGIPVIVLSAYVGRLGPDDRSLLYGVFEKPFDFDDLLSAIARASAGPESNLPTAPRFPASSTAGLLLDQSVSPSTKDAATPTNAHQQG